MILRFADIEPEFPYGKLLELRQDIRLEENKTNIHHNVDHLWNTGQCVWVAECIEHEFGWSVQWGHYSSPEYGNGVHVDHLWNVLPDGRILDATADQFGDGDNIRITDGDDPRYIVDCPCGEGI